MAKQPFTQETLYKLYEDNGVITLALIAEALPTWTLADIKQRLSGWRYRKAIDYKLEDDELIDFEFLRNKKAQQVEITEGHRLKLDLLFRQVLATSEIIEKSTAKASDRNKAMELQQKAMRAIPDAVFKELSEVYE
ncbi:TPA: hypothetical protein VA534_000901 [Streptococcus agalactiae]|uniref:hypothetical protein n=1 Tax=Streptococcus TaxID=1301 RepID=UPI0002D3ABAB|nr:MULTISPECIES: hypothetical protein [Streptococcus]QBX07797.1 hypothetical protein JavanS19_0020 [Streptococcus satellite phage Javan19]ARC23925.1 hypothetical protein A6J68_00805 [Streptococcus sp. 'group B']ASA95240.1 hypothetical protein BB162_10620 [Streptococcus agalactiae]ASZ02375.1 hypothetical protein CHF17_02142 [Streptococcus agalactiae]EPW13335.1 hypothetical protein SAG0050_02540 [Streptococcus agalactiae CCUG 17336]